MRPETNFFRSAMKKKMVYVVFYCGGDEMEFRFEGVCSEATHLNM